MEKEKPFKCDVCGKRYKNLNGLKYVSGVAVDARHRLTSRAAQATFDAVRSRDAGSTTEPVNKHDIEPSYLHGSAAKPVPLQHQRRAIPMKQHPNRERTAKAMQTTQGVACIIRSSFVWQIPTLSILPGVIFPWRSLSLHHDSGRRRRAELSRYPWKSWT